MNPTAIPVPQITVLDTGGQYTHLIARRVRELGVYADVQPSDTPAELLAARKGIIISGGPGSVYAEDTPNIDPSLVEAEVPILGICYGHQLLAHHLGGKVERGRHGEYGIAHLTVSCEDELWNGLSGSQIWMSHFDIVAAVPEGFRVTGSTEVSGIAAMSHPQRKLYGIQFHPEVVHTHAGQRILENFVFGICGSQPDWNVSQRVPLIEDRIRTAAGKRSVFFFVSGGVDSTVAYTLCLRALGPERVFGIYVDTGLMRLDETAFVRSVFQELGAENFIVERAEEAFLSALHGLIDPEAKRIAIGEQFVKVQERILAKEHFLDGHWILGQGTIYPDTIESGGTAKSDLIKTHHNRVAGIQALVDSGRVVEPLTAFYKDEVRQIGRELGVPDKFLSRHPFPGPGLAIRCLCAGEPASVEMTSDGLVLPVRSVGVQGDERSYRKALAIDRKPSRIEVEKTAPELTNRLSDINRVVAVCGAKAPVSDFFAFPATLTKLRLSLLREADAIVRKFCLQSGFDDQVWQFPVVLLPIGTEAAKDSVVLRPINSVDGMTADVVLMEREPLDLLTRQLLALPGIAGVFYDLTNKPPGTIEWE